MITVTPSLQRRFWAKVAKTEKCWNWAASLNVGGYGQIYVKEYGRAIGAHRVSYEMLVGPIPEGLEIDHLCRNRACVNPDHLEPVTKYENFRRGESPHALCAAKTHCPQGHPYTEANTYVSKLRHRQCRTCHRNREAAARKAVLRGIREPDLRLG